MRQAKATAIIHIQDIYIIERRVVAEVYCNNADEYKRLPEAIENRIIEIPIWNSNRGYYKVEVLLGKIVDLYV